MNILKNVNNTTINIRRVLRIFWLTINKTKVRNDIRFSISLWTIVTLSTGRWLLGPSKQWGCGSRAVFSIRPETPSLRSDTHPWVQYWCVSRQWSDRPVRMQSLRLYLVIKNCDFTLWTSEKTDNVSGNSVNSYQSQQCSETGDFEMRL